MWSSGDSAAERAGSVSLSNGSKAPKVKRSLAEGSGISESPRRGDERP